MQRIPLTALDGSALFLLFTFVCAGWMEPVCAESSPKQLQRGARFQRAGTFSVNISTLETCSTGGELPVRAMVQSIVKARQRLKPIPYLTITHGTFSMDEAYALQKEVAQSLSSLLGPLAGYKVAFASKAAQEQFGMDGPARGPFYLLQRAPSGSTLPATAWREMTLETEVAFTIGRRINQPIRDVTELKKHVRWVHAAFDAGNNLFDSGSGPQQPQDAIAAGVGAHFFVVGPAMAVESVDVDAVTPKLARNGELLRQSAATNVMGSPWNSLLWVANHVVKHGGALEPGMVISTGTAAPAYKATGREIQGRYVGDCGPLGSVTLTIE